MLGLKSLVVSVVGEGQYAFLEGHQILDAASIAKLSSALCH